MDIPMDRKDPGGMILVPVAVLLKQAIIDFDMRDEHNRSVPVLTRYQTGYVAASILEALARAILPEGERNRDLPDPLRLQLAHLAYDTESREPEAAIDAIRAVDASSLTENEVFAGLCRTLATKFLLVVALDPSEGTRRVVRFSYLQSLEQELRFRQRIGLDPTDLAVHIPAVDEAESYHLEVELPSGLDVRVAAGVDVQRDAGRVWSVPPLSAEGKEMPLRSHSSERAGRVHFQQIEAPVGTDAVAEVWLGALLSGFLFAAVAFAVFVPVVLGLVWLGVDGEVETPTATPLLLTVAGLVSVFVARVGEHSLVSRILFYVRVVVWMLAGLMFGAAMLVALGVGGPALDWAWAVLFGLAVATLCLMIGVSIRRDPPEHGVHKSAITIRSAEGNFLSGATSEHYKAIAAGLATLNLDKGAPK